MTGPKTAAKHPRHQTVGKGPVIGSTVVHAAVIFLAWWTAGMTREVPDFVVFDIELISPPAAELGERTPPPPEQLVIETP